MVNKSANHEKSSVIVPRVLAQRFGKGIHFIARILYIKYFTDI